MGKYLGPKTDAASLATKSDVDAKPGLSSTNPTTIEPDAAAAVGTGSTAARADHTHAIAAAAASTITGTNAEGTSTSFARADHNHAYGAKSIPFSAFPVLDGCQLLRSGFSLGNGGASAITFGSGTEIYDNGNLHSTSTNTERITVGTAGIYIVTCYGEIEANATGTRDIDIRVNGTVRAKSALTARSTFEHGVTVTLIWSAAVNDYFTMGIFQDSGGSRTTTARFTAQLLFPAS